MKVLVSDALSDVGVRIFEETPGIEVTVKTDLGPEGILKEIGEYDALVIRSATKVSREILDELRKLEGVETMVPVDL